MKEHKNQADFKITYLSGLFYLTIATIKLLKLRIKFRASTKENVVFIINITPFIMSDILSNHCYIKILTYHKHKM